MVIGFEFKNFWFWSLVFNYEDKLCIKIILIICLKCRILDFILLEFDWGDVGESLGVVVVLSIRGDFVEILR